MNWPLFQLSPKEYVGPYGSRIVRTRLSRDPDPADLFGQLRDAGVPSSMMAGVRLVRFARLTPYVVAEYERGTVRVSNRMCDIPDIARTFVHELAHHVDRRRLYSKHPVLRREKRVAWRALEDCDGSPGKDTSEYFAVGVEEFYFGDVSRLERCCPILHGTIDEMHRDLVAKCLAS